MSRFKDLYYEIKNGIKNFITFFSVVWKFRAWDHVYTLEVLKVCLQQLKKDQERDIHLDAHKCVKQLTYAIFAIDVILKEGELTNARKAHADKYGELKMIFHPSKGTNKHLGSRVEFTYTKTRGIPMLDRMASQESYEIQKREDHRTEVAIKLLGRQLRYMRGWWS